MTKEKWYKTSNFWWHLVEIVVMILLGLMVHCQNERISKLESEFQKNQTEIAKSGLEIQRSQTSLTGESVSLQKSGLSFNEVDRLYGLKKDEVDKQIKECANFEDDAELNLNNYFLDKASDSIEERDYEGALSLLKNIEKYISCSKFWRKTISVNESQLAEGYISSLKITDKLEFKIDDKSCYLGITSVTKEYAGIKVCLSPQLTFNIGEEKKFEVTDDTYYNFLIKLNGIAHNKANITIKSIHETVIQTAATTGAGEGKKQSLLWLWLFIVAVIVMIVVLLMRVKRKFAKSKTIKHKL